MTTCGQVNEVHVQMIPATLFLTPCLQCDLRKVTSAVQKCTSVDIM